MTRNELPNGTKWWVLLATLVVPLGGCGAAPDDEGHDLDGVQLGAEAWTVSATLDKAQYGIGEVMTLTIDETLVGPRTTQISDTGGQSWTKQSDNGKRMVWQATANGGGGSFTVTATVKPQSSTSQAASDTYSRLAAVAPRWPGHQPGKIYLGMSALAAEWDDKMQELAPRQPTVRRKFYDWNEPASENAQILADHAAGRLPWVSFKPPSAGSIPQSWDAISSGAYDGDIRARAQRYAALDKPVIVTFHHEPSNDGSEADGVRWANAWIHIYDVMEDETGLANTTFAPILGEWLFNPKSGQNPANWIKPGVISRQPFLGIDLYQNGNGQGYAERLGRILDWLEAQGDPDAMVGIGETGSTDHFGDPSAVEWWNEQWAWALANTDRIGVISYFNSLANSKPNHVWPLNESPAKLAAFKASLASPAVAKLP